MRIFLLTLFATTGLIATAQNDTMFFYFHKNRNQCPREYATYVGYGTKENDLIKVTMHVIETGQLLMSELLRYIAVYQGRVFRIFYGGWKNTISRLF